jgi:hypothetical protein
VLKRPYNLLLLQRHHEDVTEWLWLLYAVEGKAVAASNRDMHAELVMQPAEFEEILKQINFN